MIKDIPRSVVYPIINRRASIFPIPISDVHPTDIEIPSLFRLEISKKVPSLGQEHLRPPRGVNSRNMQIPRPTFTGEHNYTIKE